MDGISVLHKGPQRTPMLFFLPDDNTAKRQSSMTPEVSSDALILDFPNSGTVRNVLLFIYKELMLFNCGAGEDP